MASAATSILPGFAVDVSHQEVDQILTELDEIYNNQPTQWLGVKDIGMMLAHMWYEDMDEFEDAIKGPFEHFVNALPHCETKTLEDGKLVFRVKPPPPVEQRRQLVLTFEVRTGDDLHRILLKAPDAVIEVPSIEFEIGVDAKRAINSIYNHIAVAKQNLGIYAESNAAVIPAEQHLRILETIEELSHLLDVDEPFTIVVRDPSGLSELKPADRAEFEWGEQAVDHPAALPPMTRFGADELEAQLAASTEGVEETMALDAAPAADAAVAQMADAD